MYPLYAYVFKSDGQVCTRCTLMCSNLMDKYDPLYVYVFKSDGQVCTRCTLMSSNPMDLLNDFLLPIPTNRKLILYSSGFTQLYLFHFLCSVHVWPCKLQFSFWSGPLLDHQHVIKFRSCFS